MGRIMRLAAARFALFIAALLAIATFAHADAPAPVYSSWQMLGRLASDISVTNTSAATALPTGGGVTAEICNQGSTDAYVSFGAANTVSTTAATGAWIKASTCRAFNINPYPGTNFSYVAAITASSTTTLYVETGNGNW